MRGPEAIIHLDRLVYNYRAIREHLNQLPVMAVVKANGYGHGAVQVAKALHGEGVRYFAVFTLEEAIELRQAGIVEPILIFSRFHPDQLEKAAQNRITINVSVYDDLVKLIAFNSSHRKPVYFHLKIDTGMTRLGLNLSEINHVFETIKQHPELHCEGIYSHYATADEGDLSFAEYQHKLFEQVLDIARIHGVDIRYKHFSNSGAVLNLPDSWYNMVRVGMLLYGAFPSEEVPRDIMIRPVMEFRGPIVSVRTVPKGTHVSYGGKYITEKETKIGVIQTGFADGFPRPWYKGGYVSYRGKHYPIAGRVCMDQFMVDFGSDQPQEGDSVLFFGERGSDKIGVEDIAAAIGSTTYVLLTAIGGRTKRYFTYTD
ncbi:MAG: alanine racemase [Fidelibacterota bacterium]